MCSKSWARPGFQNPNQEKTPFHTGPNPGQKIPHFQAFDQTGQLRTLQNLLGPKGALLVFFRSADW
jgi:hypothetical protein